MVRANYTIGAPAEKVSDGDNQSNINNLLDTHQQEWAELS